MTYLTLSTSLTRTYWVLLGRTTVLAVATVIHGSAWAQGIPPGLGAPANVPSQPTLPHGLRGAVEIPDPWRWLRVGGVTSLVLAVCTLCFWLWWRGRKQRPRPTGPNPDDVARQRLQQALAFLDDPTRLVAEVSGAVRTYLEARFGLRAPERTTEEFVAELQSNGALADGHRQSLASFLEACDLVKFAGQRPGRGEREDLHAAALRLVNELTPAVPPPPLPTNPFTGTHSQTGGVGR